MKKRHSFIIALFLFLISCDENKIEQTSNETLDSKFDSMFSKTNIDTSESLNEISDEEILTFIEDEKTDPFKVEDSISGIGIISINYENDDAFKKLNIYDNKNKQILKIQINDSQVVTTYMGKKTTQYEEQDEPISPRYFSPSQEYFGLVFDCIDSTEEYYKVLLDKKSNTIGYIKKEENAFSFEPIESFVKGYIGLGFDINRLKNPVRKEPNEGSEIIDDPNIKKHNFWSMAMSKTEMKGDWIKVKLDNEKYGWVRWRKGNKFLIKMYFTC
jgi:hypothetical protein